VKLIFAIAVYLIIGLVLGLGLLSAAKGHWGFLAAGVLAYLILFSKIGCLPGKSH
jgi:hypothetical protein